MTVVATFRFGDNAVYCTDFRTTSSDVCRNFIQTDEAMKFVPIGAKMGLFLAGNVEYWKRIVAHLRNRVNEITCDNLFQFDGPLKRVLESWVYRDDSKACCAIGVLIDEINQCNRQFTIEISPRHHSLIQEVQDLQSVVLGTGNAIPQIEQRLDVAMRKLAKSGDFDLFQMSMALENEIKQSIVECGSGAFVRLGISPIMATAYLEGTYFCLPGTETEHVDVSADRMCLSNYSFKRSVYGGLVLIDHVTKELQELKGIAELENLSSPKFDPLALEQQEDPADLFPDVEWAYCFEQWTIPPFQLSRVPQICRVIKRIDFVSEYRLGKSTVLAKGLVNIDNDGSYKSVNNHFFTIKSAEISKEFESGLLDDNRLWDDEWLSKFVVDLNVREI